MGTDELSESAVAARLHRASQLRRLCLSLSRAGVSLDDSRGPDRSDPEAGRSSPVPGREPL